MRDDYSSEAVAMAPTWLDLYDYRQRVAAMYRERNMALGAGEDARAVCERFRQAKDELYASHSQSPLDADARSHFTGLRYFPYDASSCVQAQMTPVGEELDTGSGAAAANTASAEAIPHRRAAYLDFEIVGTSARLVVFWLDVYGGGLLLPFRDATCPDESYGAGRYLFDTVKGSDFVRLQDAVPAPETWGYRGGQVLLDFNYAYNPSCAYDPRWVCPLAPRENWLGVPIRAGERTFG
ncbi:MAG: DUF1684 domain-containing protein [Ktedonobacterales bacterium]